MTCAETTLRFIAAFCEGDLEQIATLLAEDFAFSGPLIQAGTRREYLRELTRNPPEPGGRFSVLRIVENHSEAVVFWRYEKPSGETVIAQWNRCRGDQIAEMELVFGASPTGRSSAS